MKLDEYKNLNVQIGIYLKILIIIVDLSISLEYIRERNAEKYQKEID